MPPSKQDNVLIFEPQKGRAINVSEHHNRQGDPLQKPSNLNSSSVADQVWKERKKIVM